MPNNYFVVQFLGYGSFEYHSHLSLSTAREKSTMASKPTNRWGMLLLGTVFLVFIGTIIYQSQPSPVASAAPPQIKEPPQLKNEWYRVETARGEILENKSIVGNCHLCHAYWVPIPRSEQTSNPRFAHANIQINHGNNDRCYNCHHIADRNKYVANDGSPLMVRNVELLCARCHGLIYNDWLAGTHGKWTGAWTSEGGEQETFGCTECHDPHNPFFKYDVITPPPVWSEKFIRSTLEDEHHDGPWSNFLVEEEPEEIF